MTSPNLAKQSMSIKVSVSGNVSGTAPSQDYSPRSYPLNISKTVGPFTVAGNTNALGADECYSAPTQIVAGGNATINLLSWQDLLGQTGVSFARIKGFVVRLLSTADDSVIGSKCSGVTFNSSPGTDLAPLPGLAGLVLGNGDVFAWATSTPNGIAITSTTGNIYIANNDGINPAAVEITLIGGTN